MPRRLTGIWLVLLVSVIARAQGESVLLQHDRYREKVAVAEALGLDTLPAFRVQMAHYKQVLSTGKQLNETWHSSMQRSERIKVIVITRKLAQHASKEEEFREKTLMDSIYAALKKGGDFEELAVRYSTDSYQGRPHWIPVVSLLQEWANCLNALPKGEVSQPFYSSEGIHLLKWTERASFEEEKTGGQFAESMTVVRLQEIRETLLAAALTRKYQVPLDYTENDLKDFFKDNKKNYAWDLPHFRGAAVHCRNKKEAKSIKKLLKKYPMEEWPKVFGQLTNGRSDAPRMDYGLFQIGTHACIDKLVFKCGPYQSSSQLPYTFVMGKKLKKGPEDYTDIRERVLKDYLNCHQYDWLDRLKREYKVEFNEDVLKTVNNE